MRSIKERVLHTVLFEIGAVGIVSPVIAWATGTPLAEAGLISLALSAVATACNYGWTIVVDRFVPTRRRGLQTRIVQAVGLELIISCFAIPLFYFAAHATLLEAVLLDVSGIGFFILYAMAYNWAFDAVMIRIESV